MKYQLSNKLLSAIFKFIPNKKLFTVFAPVSQEWRRIAADIRPVSLFFKKEIPTQELITDIITVTEWNIDAIEVDLTFATTISSLETMKRVKITTLKIGNTAIANIDDVLNSSKDTLTTLWLNNVPNFTETEFEKLPKFKKLRELIISYNDENFTDAAMNKLPKKWDSLEILDISNTDITRVDALSGYINLRVLNLSMTLITDISPLANLTKLETLDIQGTNVRDVSMIKISQDGNNPNNNYNPGILLYRSEADTENDFRDYDRDTDPYTIGPTDNTIGYNIEDADNRYHAANHDIDHAAINIDRPEQAGNYLSLREAAANAAERRLAEQQNTLMYRGETRAVQPDDDELISFNGN